MVESDDIRTAVMRVPMLGDELQLLEKRVRSALRKKDWTGLGGRTGAVATVYEHSGFACHRLPPLPEGRFQAYQALFEEHLVRLQRAGITVVISEPRVLTRKGGTIVVYVVQKAVPEDKHLGPWLTTREPGADEVQHVWDRILTQVFAAVRDGLGLDARVHQWVVPGRNPQYLGAAVPLLRSSAGREELDTDIVFGRSPGWLRGVVASLVLERMRTPYHSPRSVALDLIADLRRRSLDHHEDPLLRMTNGRLGRAGLPAIDPKEVGARRRNAESTDLLLTAMANLDVSWNRLRGRPARCLPPPK